MSRSQEKKSTLAQIKLSEIDGVHTGALLRLSSFVEADLGFQFIIASCEDSAYRDRLIDHLSQIHAKQRVLDISDFSKTSQFEASLLEIVSDHPPLIHIVGASLWMSRPEGLRWIHNLNYRRERIAEQTPVTLVFWLHHEQVTQFAHEAPDLWAWRTASLEFPRSEIGFASEIHKQFINPGFSDLEKQKKRLKEIDSYFENKKLPEASDIPLYDEKTKILIQQGLLKTAKITAEKALSLSRKVDDRRATALVYGKIADILQLHGKWDEALEIRKKEQLPIFERLGDAREKAVTMGQITDILRSRGQLDEALEILKEEVLPAFERLDDVRSKAVTMGQIADILRSRGQLDEALEILKEEVLPTFEQLDDVRSKAITMGRIADILQFRGQLDEALKTLREEVLPAFEQLGDVSSRAITMGRIADILQSRGHLDETLAIRREELPIYEQLGNMHLLLSGRAKLAVLLLETKKPDVLAEANHLLKLALSDAKRLQLPEAQTIQSILEKNGMSKKP